MLASCFHQKLQFLLSRLSLVEESQLYRKHLFAWNGYKIFTVYKREKKKASLCLRVLNSGLPKLRLNAWPVEPPPLKPTSGIWFFGRKSRRQPFNERTSFPFPVFVSTSSLPKIRFLGFQKTETFSVFRTFLRPKLSEERFRKLLNAAAWRPARLLKTLF